MDKIINILFGLLVGVIATIGYNMALAPTQPLGGAAGDFHSNHETFASGVTLGGRVFATSSVGAATYTAASLTDVTLIQHTAASALTATLPASSTLTSFVPRAGDTRTIFLAPITTGITLAGGTGTDLNTASSTKFCVVSQVCRLDFTRKVNSDIEVLLTNSSGN